MCGFDAAASEERLEQAESANAKSSAVKTMLNSHEFRLDFILLRRDGEQDCRHEFIEQFISFSAFMLIW